MAQITDEHGNPVQLTDEHGIPVQLTDEYGNPMHLTGIATAHDPKSSTLWSGIHGQPPSSEAGFKQDVQGGGAGGPAASITSGKDMHDGTLKLREPDTVDQSHGITAGRRVHGGIVGAEATAAEMVSGQEMYGGSPTTETGVDGGGGGLHRREELRHSGSSSSSSSSEDDEQGGRRRKKGLKDKIKEKLIRGKQKDDHLHTATIAASTTVASTTVSMTTAVAGPAGRKHHEHEKKSSPPRQEHHAHEKKSMIEKIKEKLPGHHHGH